MKVLIQKSGTDLFLSEAGLWLAGRHTAHDYKQAALASKVVCLRKNDPDTRVIVAFPDEKYDIHLDPFSIA